MRNLIVLVSFLLSAAGPLGAQSLADVAKAAQDRRKSEKDTAKVYTNADLVGSLPPVSEVRGSKSVDGQADPQAATPPAADQAGAVPSAAPPPGQADGVEKDRAYWSGRLQGVRDQADRDRTLAEALQTRLNSLASDIVNRDDPAQRAKIEQDRQRTLTELDRLKKSADAAQKAVAAVEEEARRAGVPPGWLR